MFQLIISYDGKEYKHEFSTVKDLDSLIESEIIDKKASSKFADNFNKPNMLRYIYYLKDRNVIINVICGVLGHEKIVLVDTIMVQYNDTESCDIKVTYNGLEIDSSYFDNPLFDTICKDRRTREFVDNYTNRSMNMYRRVLNPLVTVDKKEIILNEKVDCKDMTIVYEKKSYDLEEIPDRRIMKILTKVEI